MEFDINKMTSGNHQYDKTKRSILDNGTLRVNDLIAPDAIELDVNFIKVGDRYLRTIIVTGYPRTSRIGWLNSLYSYAANIDISSHVEPLKTDQVIKALNKKIGQYTSTQRMDMEKGRISDIAIETAKEDAVRLRSNLQKGQERMYYQFIYINVAGKSIEEMDRITEEVESKCGQLGLTTRHAMFQQDLGFSSVLPIADDRIRHRRNFDSSSLATCMPFVSAELTDTGGTPILYGLNMINGSLVMFDRFNLPNYNSVTLATSGAGKSYFVKLEAIRYMSLGAEVIIIDPQGEYERIAKALGGQHIKLSTTSQDKINPLDITSTVEEESGQNFLSQKMMDVYSIIEVMINKELNATQRKVLLSAIEKAYEKYDISRHDKGSLYSKNHAEDNFFQLEGSKKKMPTLSDLDAALRAMGRDGIDIAEELSPYVGDGVMNIFDGETNVDLNAKFTVFDIKDMEKQLADLGMFIVLEYVWNKIKLGDGKRRMLVIDEAWMLMQNQQSLDYVNRVARTARKFNAGLSIITQQVGDFVKYGGDSIIGNAQMHVLLKQSKSDLKEVSDQFGLSKSEESFLKTASPGEALIYAGGNHTAVQVVSHQFEHILCTTKQSEIDKIKDLLD